MAENLEAKEEPQETVKAKEKRMENSNEKVVRVEPWVKATKELSQQGHKTLLVGVVCKTLRPHLVGRTGMDKSN